MAPTTSLRSSMDYSSSIPPPTAHQPHFVLGPLTMILLVVCMTFLVLLAAAAIVSKLRRAWRDTEQRKHHEKFILPTIYSHNPPASFFPGLPLTTPGRIGYDTCVPVSVHCPPAAHLKQENSQVVPEFTLIKVLAPLPAQPKPFKPFHKPSDTKATPIGPDPWVPMEAVRDILALGYLDHQYLRPSLQKSAEKATCHEVSPLAMVSPQAAVIIVPTAPEHPMEAHSAVPLVPGTAKPKISKSRKALGSITNTTKRSRTKQKKLNAKEHSRSKSSPASLCLLERKRDIQQIAITVMNSTEEACRFNVPVDVSFEAFSKRLTESLGYPFPTTTENGSSIWKMETFEQWLEDNTTPHHTLQVHPLAWTTYSPS